MSLKDLTYITIYDTLLEYYKLILTVISAVDISYALNSIQFMTLARGHKSKKQPTITNPYAPTPTPRYTSISTVISVNNTLFARAKCEHTK